MSKKAFVVWGLIIIQLYVTVIAIIQYLALSKIIDIAALNLALSQGLYFLPIISFGVILHLRSKTAARQKRIWALSVPLYLAFAVVGYGLFYIYMITVLAESGNHNQLFEAIADWAKNNTSSTEMTFTVKQKLGYIFAMLPMHYLLQLGLFALLWFGSLDPKDPFVKRHRIKSKDAQPA